MSNLLISPSAFNASMLGVFGTGKILPIGTSTTWTIPAGITTVRVRVWGAGANHGGGDYGVDGGGGGGFAIKTITGLTPGGTVAVTVGQSSGATSSFGAYVSATGGSMGGAGGTGSGGDINTSGGSAGSSGASGGGGGGGAGSLFGNGGLGGSSKGGKSGASGGGSGNSSSGGTVGGAGGSGLTGSPGTFNVYVIPGNNTAYSYASSSDTGIIPSIDFIGTGPGGSAAHAGGGHAGANGGGGGGGNGGQGGAGGFPGGGAGGGSSGGAAGLVIVEY